MKKIRVGGGHVGDDLPDAVAGASGHETIAEKFREVYQTLHNSSESVEAMKKLADQVGTLSGKKTVEFGEKSLRGGGLSTKSQPIVKKLKGGVSRIPTFNYIMK